MPVTQIEICNSALINIGAERISAITQDAKRAILLNAVWDQQRRYVLRAHKWNFATKRVSLTPTATTPSWGYDYEYNLPNDCLRFLDTDPDDTDFVTESDADGAEKVLRTSETSIDGLYIFDCDNPSLFDSCYAEALSWKLSHTISYAITQSSKVREDCMAAYKAILSEARSIDGAEGILKGLEADTFKNARRGRTFNGRV